MSARSSWSPADLNFPILLTCGSMPIFSSVPLRKVPGSSSNSFARKHGQRGPLRSSLGAAGITRQYSRRQVAGEYSSLWSV